MDFEFFFFYFESNVDLPNFVNTKRHRILRFKINLNFYSHFTAITVERITGIALVLFFVVCFPKFACRFLDFSEIIY